jgi:threonine dehydrogenase-like Zn-dependent dehydrogenase
MGYTTEQLTWAMIGLIPYGGLRATGVQPGETVVVAPALGARVVAMGRNDGELLKLREVLGPRVETVRITGDMEEELSGLKEFGRIDAFFDIFPAEALTFSHTRAGILSLRLKRRVAFMDRLLEDVSIPSRFVMRFIITIKGKWMYSRGDMSTFIRMLNSGVLDVRKMVRVLGAHKLEEWEKTLRLRWDQEGWVRS